MDFICHLHPGWSPTIRTAPVARDWMDQSPDSYAYRCLPLNVANTHGWEILTPVGFSAYWRGGTAASDVIVQCDPGTPYSAAPVSLFGQSTFTIHIEGLFRTPPGWNLWVGGTPNRFKDGVAALTGIVETDWSPYTFTMNWKITRRNHWIRFDAGEPVCFIFPIQRGALEAFEPKFAPFTDDISEQFSSWSKSRNDLHAAVAAGSNKETWQKRYYRGMDMHDKCPVADHQIKARLKEFK